MRKIYFVLGFGAILWLNGCARAIMEDNHQKTQPLLTQMLCPYCEVPSLQPAQTIVVKAAPVEKRETAPQTITTINNPDDNAAPTEIPPQTPTETPVQTPTEIPVQTPQTASQPPVSSGGTKVITLDLNAPNFGIPAQSAPAAPTSSPVPPQSKRDDEDDDSDSEEMATVETPNSSTIQLSEADIHNAQDVHELTVRLMNMNQ